MRSTPFLSLLCLFPLLISGLPTLIPRCDDHDNSTVSNTTLATISSQNSSGTNVAENLMVLNLFLADNYYSQAQVLSNLLNDSETSTIISGVQQKNQNQLDLLNANPTILGNCSFNLGPLIDKTNTKNLVASTVYLEMMKNMGGATILSQVGSDAQGAIQTINEDAVQIASLLSTNGVPLSSTPDMSFVDYATLLRKYSDSDCFANLGLGNLTVNLPFTFATPFFLGLGAGIGDLGSGCADPSAPAFCQSIGSSPNASVSPLEKCTLGATIGVNLFYITPDQTPLSADPAVRETQTICTGPEMFFV